MAFSSTCTQKKFLEENYLTMRRGGGSPMIWGAFSSSEKTLTTICQWLTAADYVKILNIYHSHTKGVVYVEKNGFFSKIMLLSTMHQ